MYSGAVGNGQNPGFCNRVTCAIYLKAIRDLVLGDWVPYDYAASLRAGGPV